MKQWLQILLIVTLLPFCYWVCSRVVFLDAVVVGHSMEPTYYNSNVVAMTKIKLLYRSPRKGDVVLIREYNDFGRGDGRIDIKRVAYVTNNLYYVLGDNTNSGASFDSRCYGPLPLKQVLGVAWK